MFYNLIGSDLSKLEPSPSPTKVPKENQAQWPSWENWLVLPVAALALLAMAKNAKGVAEKSTATSIQTGYWNGRKSVRKDLKLQFSRDFFFPPCTLWANCVPVQFWFPADGNNWVCHRNGMRQTGNLESQH